VVDAAFRAALDGLEPGAEVFVLTWLDRADRTTLAVHPRSRMASSPSCSVSRLRMRG
jgi:tRNA (Thr-GGU) A37 N-methylase